MVNLDETRESIKEMIDKINKIGKFESTSFSTERFKSEVIPLLKNAQQQINDVEELYQKIDIVRNEIIEPVNKTINRRTQQGNVLAFIGIVFGLIGFVLTLFTIFNQKISFSDASIERIAETNQKLLSSQVELKAKDLIKQRDSLRFEKSIYLYAETRDGKLILEKFIIYLQNLGYKNIKVQALNNRQSISVLHKPFYQPLIYYRAPEIDCQILIQIGQYLKDFQPFSNSIDLIEYNSARVEEIKNQFKDNAKLCLLIVL